MPRYSERTGALQTYQVGPFDSSHLYVQFGGKLPGLEKWSCGFRMWKSGGSGVGDASPILASIGSAIVDFHTRSGSQIDTRAKLSFVKVNTIGTNGKYVGDGSNEATYADVAGAGGVTVSHPNQIALAATMVTGFTRGVAHSGRFYMPLPAINVTANGALAPENCALVEESLETLRTAVNSAGGGHVMTVMSRKAGSPGHRAVTGFKVGRVLDTQRRRRRSLVEAYVG